MACATLKRTLDWDSVLGGGRPAKRRRCAPFCTSPTQREKHGDRATGSSSSSPMCSSQKSAFPDVLNKKLTPGHCKCGSRIKCLILPRIDREEIIKIECTASKGNGDCGKRQCRGETRKRVVAQLQHQSTQSYRSGMAAKMMKEGDSVEPPLLYNADVLRTAKLQALQEKYRNPNPIMACSDLKRSGCCENVVRHIGFDPVLVHFWSPHQIRLYNDLISREHIRMCVDASGEIAKSLKHIDGKNSQHIFLYILVLYCSFGQFTVGSMFSEHQDTVTILTWLLRWLQSGAKCPKELVCDSSKALLNASARAFTGHDTIEIYAEACMSNKVPRTYIRIDVSHYIKNWADFLSNEKGRVKQFYMFAIGQLILCRGQADAAEIIRNLLIISTSETAGDGAEIVKDAVEFIKRLICTDTQENKEIKSIIDATLKDEEENACSTEIDEDLEEYEGHILQNWATSIKDEIDFTMANVQGDDINPRYCPKFATRLLKQIRTIPVWSCVCRDEFGFGRIPASSAPVEGEFKIIKNQIIPKATRIDLAVETLVNYYNGKLKLVDCSVNSKSQGSVLSSQCRNFNDYRDAEEFEQSDIDITDVEPEKNEHQTIETLGKQRFFKNEENKLPADGKDIAQKPFERRSSLLVRRYLSDITSRQNFGGESSLCSVCNDGNYPTGAHKCIMCKSNVHIIEGCSVAIGDEEGYGEDRLCMQCYENSSKESRLALNDFENWRGNGKPETKRRPAKYLNKGNQELIDRVTSAKNRTLPILKNGSDISLKFVAYKRAKLTLIQTCAFDSLFQVFLAGITDDANIKDHLAKNRTKNMLFETVLDVEIKKITTKTYQNRAKVHLEYRKFNNKGTKISLKPDTIEEIDCACNVISLANFLFQETPSFKESSICPAGCTPRIKSLPTITITDKELKEPLGDVINNHVVLPGVQCQQNDCTEMENNQIDTIEYMAENIRAELKRLQRRKQLQYTMMENSDSSGNEGSNEISPSQSEKPIFTFKQVGIICDRMLRERESEIREEYDTVLTTKLAEQYDAFVKFTYDQIQRHYSSQTAPSYLS